MVREAGSWLTVVIGRCLSASLWSSGFENALSLVHRCFLKTKKDMLCLWLCVIMTIASPRSVAHRLGERRVKNVWRDRWLDIRRRLSASLGFSGLENALLLVQRFSFFHIYICFFGYQSTCSIDCFLHFFRLTG